MGGLSSRVVLTSLAAAAAAGVAAARVRALWAGGPTDFDDAYMFIRYAENLLRGHGVAWNPGGEATFGVSSLVHLVVVALLRVTLPELPDGRLLQVTSLGAALLSVALLAAAGASSTRHGLLSGRALLLGAVLLSLLASHHAFIFHAGSGMDTMLAIAGNALLVHATLRLVRDGTRRAALAAALAGMLAYLVRPDSGLCALLCPVLAIALLRPPPRRRLFASFGVAFGLLLAVDLFLKWRGFGLPFPLALLAKRPGAYGGFAGEYTWNPLLFLRVFAGGVLPFAFLLLALARRADLRLLAVLLLPPLLTAVFHCSMNQIMGHRGRFFFPTLPFVVVAAVLVLDRRLCERGERPAVLSPRRLGLRAAVAAAVLAAGGAGLEAAGRHYEARAASQRLASLGGYVIAADAPLPTGDSWRSSEEMARLASAAPPGTVFAMSEHGLVGARAPDVVIVDVLGLHDRVFAREGFSAAELLGRRPDLIWMPHWDHTQMLRDILDSDEFWRAYAFFPDALTYGVALRRGSPHFHALLSLFRERFRANHPGLRPENYLARRSGG